METLSELLAYLFTPIAQVAIIMALAELVKGLGIKSKYIPLFDVGLGLVSGLGVYTLYQGMQPVEGIVLGLALGLSACGLFSGIKNLTQK